MTGRIESKRGIAAYRTADLRSVGRSRAIKKRMKICGNIGIQNTQKISRLNHF